MFKLRIYRVWFDNFLFKHILNRHYSKLLFFFIILLVIFNDISMSPIFILIQIYVILFNFLRLRNLFFNFSFLFWIFNILIHILFRLNITLEIILLGICELFIQFILILLNYLDWDKSCLTFSCLYCFSFCK